MPTTLLIRPWNDPVLDTLGHDPRSLYVEKFWLPTLGPTSLLLLRHLAAKFDRHPDGIELTLASTSQALGLGARDGTSSPLVRTLTRLAQFDLACDDGRGTIAVRRHIPPVNRRHLRRLPPELQTEHAQWTESTDGEAVFVDARRRARRVAFTLIEQGDDADQAERVLHSTGFHPAICREAAMWAYQRHRELVDDAGTSPAPSVAVGLPPDTAA